MAKKITLKNKNGDVLCPHTAIEQVQGLKEALDDKLGKTEKAASATNANTSKKLCTAAYGGGDLNLNTFTVTDGSVEYRSIIPNTAANMPDPTGYQNSVMCFGLHSNGATAQMFFSKDNPLYYRSSQTGGWKQLRTMNDLVTTSHIADTSITSEKLAQSLILRGTPQLETQPTPSSESQNIASVGLVKKAVDGIEIDTRNLLSDSEEITIDGSALTSGTKYEVRKLPISVVVGDVLTFNCEDLIINAGTGQTHAIVLRVPGVGALAPMQWISPTSKTATITVTQASDTPHLYIYAGYADDSAGKSITYKGATLVKGNKPMLTWQAAPEDVEAKIEAAKPTIFLQTLQPSATEVKEGDIWIIQ